LLGRHLPLEPCSQLSLGFGCLNQQIFSFKPLWFEHNLYRSPNPIGELVSFQSSICYEVLLATLLIKTNNFQRGILCQSFARDTLSLEKSS
jgi:hypothetical protein